MKEQFDNLNLPDDIKYVKDFLPIGYQDDIIKTVKDMPWYWHEKITFYSDHVYADPNSEFDDPKISDAFAFSHLCFDDTAGGPKSQYYEFFSPILRFLEFKLNIRVTELLRLRLRLSTQYPGHTLEKYNPPHVDIMSTDSFKTFVYYVDDSDGDTVVFDKKYDNGINHTLLLKNELNLRPLIRSAPKKGEGVYFDGRYYHSGNSPVNHRSRYIVNFDFKIEE